MKKTIALFLTLALLCALAAPAFAAGTADLTAANGLHALGLFQGTGTNPDGSPVYDLDRAPTRNEAVTMLVRLLGKEGAAKSGSWSTPFTDVADWAKPYVGYAYANGLTNGTGATTFSGESKITASQYLTFVLRALGYDSSKDFRWDAAWELSDRIGLTGGEYNASSTFLRGNVAAVSWATLPIVQKGTNVTLAQKLINEGVFTTEQYKAARTGQPETTIVFSRTNLIYQIKTSELNDYLSWGYSTEPFTIEWTDSGSYWQKSGSMLDIYDWGDSIGEADIADAFLSGETISTVYFDTDGMAVPAFILDGRSSVTRVELADSIQSIGAYAFDGCSLKRIGIPASVTSISEYAFSLHGANDILGNNKDMVIYGESGSYAETFAKNYGIPFVPAKIVYDLNCWRTVMLSAEERGYYLGRNVWFSEPVTRLYAEDGRSQIVPQSEIDAYLSVGWHYYYDVYTSLYALDGRTKDVLNSQVAAEEAVGWYTWPHYLVNKADQYLREEGYDSAVTFLEEHDYSFETYPEVGQKFRDLLKNWQQAIGCPVAITYSYVDTDEEGTPEVYIYFRNLTDKTVNRLDVTWTCLDAYGRVTTDYSMYNGNFDGYMTGDSIEPYAETWFSWSLTSNTQTTSITNLHMTGVAFTDGSYWMK